MTNQQKTICGFCNNELDEIYNLPLESRTQCLKCDSMNRFLYPKLATESVELHDKINGRQKRPCQKIILEFVQGKDWNRDLGLWMNLVRIFDKRKNFWPVSWYYEIITKPNGDDHHFCSEPLSQHTGHGSDKKVKE